MAVLHSIAVTFGRITTLLQVILYLPLTLDVAGQDAFLALSASLASYYAFLSTVRTLTRKTSLAWLGDFLAIFQFVVVPACLLVVFNVYSPPSESYFSNVNRRYGAMDLESPSADQLQESIPSSTARRLFGGSRGPAATSLPVASSIVGIRSSSSSSITSSSSHGLNLSDESPLSIVFHTTLASTISWTFFLARHVPPWWHLFLRLSSPVFSLLEGVATLLVIQVVGSFSRWMIASSLTRRPPTPRSALFGWVQAIGSALTSAEFLQLFFLLLSALVYVISALALYVSFEGATRNRPGTAAATGVALSSTLWLTAIAFAVHRGNVIETSLMFAYVVWNVYQLSDSLSFTADPLALIRSIKVLDTSSPLFFDFSGVYRLHLPPYLVSLVELLMYALGQSARFLAAAGAALPKSVIVSLIYRLMVLYSASRILPLLKRQSAKGGWDGEGWASSSSSSSSSGADFTSSESESEEESASGTEVDSSDSDQSVRIRGSQMEKSKSKGKGKAREVDVPLRNGKDGMSDAEKRNGKRRVSQNQRQLPQKPRQAQKQASGEGDNRARRTRRARSGGIREEEPFGAFISFIVSYARLILIAVYSHLLLLDQSHMVYWRFLTVGITLFVWAFELLLGKDDNPDAAFAGSWR